MSRKRNNKVNRTNGFHGNYASHSNNGSNGNNKNGRNRNEKERGSIEASPHGSVDTNSTHLNDHDAFKPQKSFNNRVSGMLKNMNREMSTAAADIGKSIADVVTPLLAAAVNLPDMELKMRDIVVSKNKYRTTFCFNHPQPIEFDDDDDDDDGYEEYNHHNNHNDHHNHIDLTDEEGLLNDCGD